MMKKSSQRKAAAYEFQYEQTNQPNNRPTNRLTRQCVETSENRQFSPIFCRNHAKIKNGTLFFKRKPIRSFYSKL